MNAFCMPSLPYKNLELLKLRFYDYVLTSWVPGLRNVSLLHTDVIHRKKVAMDFSNSVPPGHQEPPFTFSNLPSVVPVLPYRAGVLGWFPPRPVCVWGLHSLHVHEWASSGFSSSLTKKCTGLSPLRLTNPLLCSCGRMTWLMGSSPLTAQHRSYSITALSADAAVSTDISVLKSYHKGCVWLSLTDLASLWG